MSLFRLAWKSFATMEDKEEPRDDGKRYAWVIDNKMGIAWRLYFGRFGIFGKVIYLAPMQNGYIQHQESAPTLNWFQRKVMFYRIVWASIRAEANKAMTLREKREAFIREHAVTTMMNGGSNNE